MNDKSCLFAYVQASLMNNLFTHLSPCHTSQFILPHCFVKLTTRKQDFISIILTILISEESEKCLLLWYLMTIFINIIETIKKCPLNTCCCKD